MTKKGAVFKWTKECNAAFKFLREADGGASAHKSTGE